VNDVKGNRITFEFLLSTSFNPSNWLIVSLSSSLDITKAAPDVTSVFEYSSEIINGNKFATKTKLTNLSPNKNTNQSFKNLLSTIVAH